MRDRTKSHSPALPDAPGKYAGGNCLGRRDCCLSGHAVVSGASNCEIAMKSASNYHDTREGWLRAATNELRDYFKRCGYPLPDNIRFAIGFPSTGRKGNRVGECWHSS